MDKIKNIKEGDVIYCVVYSKLSKGMHCTKYIVEKTDCDGEDGEKRILVNSPKTYDRRFLYAPFFGCREGIGYYINYGTSKAAAIDDLREYIIQCMYDEMAELPTSDSMEDDDENIEP